MKITHQQFLVLILTILELEDCGASTKTRKKRSRLLCSKGQDSCGNSCYDYNYYSCQEGVNGRQKFLCFKDELGCGDKCYDPSEYNCHGSGEDQLVCRWNERKCGLKCYNPKQENCSRGKVVNAKTTQVRQYYSSSGGYRNGNDRNPGNFGIADDFFTSSNFNFNNHRAENKPVDNFDRSSTTCPRHHLLCGFKCYDPELKTCFRETIGTTRLTILCSVGQRICNNRCYDPYHESCTGSQGSENDNNGQSKSKFHSSSSHSNVECPRGQLMCDDGWCYNSFDGCPKKTKSMTTGNGLMRVSSSHGFSASSNSGYPGHHISSSSTFQCRKGYQKCGDSCFDPRTSECLSRGQGQFQRCDSGSEVCGTKCYDPFNEKCLGDGGNGKIVCRWNEKACGNRCYDAFKENCYY